MPEKKKYIVRFRNVPLNGRAGKADLYLVNKETNEEITSAKINPQDSFERLKLGKYWEEEGYGKAEELARAIDKSWCKKVREVREQGEKDTEPKSVPGACYVVKNGCICRRRFDRDGECLEPLCNFVATIEAEMIKDDGSGDIQHHFRISGELANGEKLETIDVPSGQFAGMNWPLNTWGTRTIVLAGFGAKDHLRVAIQERSQNVQRHVIYRHMGWRKINGRWAYLHAGGAIGPDGPVSGVEVDLPGNLSFAVLPDPCTGSRLLAAVQAVLRILELSVERITASALGTVFRAPLGQVDFSSFLLGVTGSFKTSLATLQQQFWGAEFSAERLPGNFTSTANANEEITFLASDAVCVVDDFAPGGPQIENARAHKEAGRLFRSAGNRSGRHRLRSDGELRSQRPTRALVLGTGEDLPKGHSVRARVAVIEIRRPPNKDVNGDTSTALVQTTEGDFIDVDKLTECQADGRDGLYAAAMSAYVRWIAKHYEELQQQRRDKLHEFRQLFHSNSAHARTPGMLGDLYWGWKTFLRFAVEEGVLSEQEKTEYLERAKSGITVMGSQQFEHQQTEEPAGQFVALLRAAIAAGRAHVASITDARPDNDKICGWRPNTKGEMEPQGTRVGWIDDIHVYLIPEVAHAVAQRLASDSGDSLGVTRHTLGKRLFEQGHLIYVEENQQKLMARKVLAGSRRYVWAMKSETLGLSHAQETGPTGPSGPPES
jgi:hypothetical protein